MHTSRRRAPSVLPRFSVLSELCSMLIPSKASASPPETMRTPARACLTRRGAVPAGPVRGVRGPREDRAGGSAIACVDSLALLSLGPAFSVPATCTSQVGWSFYTAVTLSPELRSHSLARSHRLWLYTYQMTPRATPKRIGPGRVERQHELLSLAPGGVTSGAVMRLLSQQTFSSSSHSLRAGRRRN